MLLGPIALVGNLWFGLAGLIWSLTVTGATVFVVGAVMWLVSRSAMDRDLAAGSAERTEQVLEQIDA